MPSASATRLDRHGRVGNPAPALSVEREVLSYTYTDPDGTPHEVSIDYSSRVSVVAHNRMTRVDWYMRIYKVDSAGLLNVFFWDNVW